ncbi:MAG TPA: hypothetical protein VGX37_02725 [Allosphingosinicella sp.]|jgi:hypothetical protein|nr:hypothetical protein [Allosphingosinicella sp.]
MESERDEDAERGKPATFDRRTGEVHGSGSGTGGGGNPNEDYDADPMAGAGAAPAAAPRPEEEAEHGPPDRLDGGHA